MEECELQINMLDLKAILFGLKSLCSKQRSFGILLKIEDTSTVTSINKIGSFRYIQMDNVAKDVWNWAIMKNIWLTATHIPRFKDNG